MSTQGFDHRRFKAQERAGFNRIAEHYDKGADLRADLQRALLDEAALQPGEHVLDLASGPGLLARDATLRVGERGKWWPATLPRRCCRWGCAGPPKTARRAALRGRGRRAAALRRGPLRRGAARPRAVHVPSPRARPRRGAQGPAPGWPVGALGVGPRESVPLISHAQDCIARVLPQPRVQRPRCSASATPDRSSCCCARPASARSASATIDCIAISTTTRRTGRLSFRSRVERPRPSGGSTPNCVRNSPMR